MPWEHEEDEHWLDSWEPEWPEAAAGPEYRMYGSVPPGTAL